MVDPKSCHFQLSSAELKCTSGQPCLSSLPKSTPLLVRTEESICIISFSQFHPVVWFLWLVFWHGVTCSALLFLHQMLGACQPLFLLLLYTVPHLPQWSPRIINVMNGGVLGKGKQEVRKSIYLNLHYLPEGSLTSGISRRDWSATNGWQVASFTVPKPWGIVSTYFLSYFRWTLLSQTIFNKNQLTEVMS